MKAHKWYCNPLALMALPALICVWAFAFDEPDVNDVIRLCDMYNIPMATNLATAELIILAIDRGDLDWREMYR